MGWESLSRDASTKPQLDWALPKRKNSAQTHTCKIKGKKWLLRLFQQIYTTSSTSCSFMMRSTAHPMFPVLFPLDFQASPDPCNDSYPQKTSPLSPNLHYYSTLFSTLLYLISWQQHSSFAPKPIGLSCLGKAEQGFAQSCACSLLMWRLLPCWLLDLHPCDACLTSSCQTPQTMAEFSLPLCHWNH